MQVFDYDYTKNKYGDKTEKFLVPRMTKWLSANVLYECLRASSARVPRYPSALSARVSKSLLSAWVQKIHFECPWGAQFPSTLCVRPVYSIKRNGLVKYFYKVFKNFSEYIFHLTRIPSSLLENKLCKFYHFTSQI